MKRATRAIRAAALALCLAGTTIAQESKPVEPTYSVKEIRDAKAADLFTRLGDPAPGRDPFAALHALVEKAKGSDSDRDQIIKLGSETALDAKAPEGRRWQSLYVLSGIADPRVVPPIAKALETDTSPVVRGVAACALGALSHDDAKAALKKASATEKNAEVKGWIERALAGEIQAPAVDAGDAGRSAAAPVVNQASVLAVLAGTHYSVALVKDFLRIENTGGPRANVEFERYTPVIDAEQFVVARWFDGAHDDGAPVPVQAAAVRVDDEGNLVHTLRIPEFPEFEQVLVTMTTLVARRERPAPQGAFPIPARDAYPEPVRAYLASTPMVDAEHAAVRQQAAELRTRAGADALKFAYELATMMKGKSYAMTGQPDPGTPTSAVVLKFGGSCCGSAVCAAALFRSAGIPAQVTYCPPPSYVHGIVQFYLNGYGWVRMDSTCGTGKMPLVQEDRDLSLVRLFDTPMKMEQVWHAYAWPYHNNDEAGDYRFRADGKECATLRFATRDKGMGHVSKPFPHLEPGSWSTVLGMEAMPTQEEWAAMESESRHAVVQRQVGEIEAILRRAPALRAHAKAAREFARPAPADKE